MKGPEIIKVHVTFLLRRGDTDCINKHTDEPLSTLVWVLSRGRSKARYNRGADFLFWHKGEISGCLGKQKVQP